MLIGGLQEEYADIDVGRMFGQDLELVDMRIALQCDQFRAEHIAAFNANERLRRALKWRGNQYLRRLAYSIVLLVRNQVDRLVVLMPPADI